ncbi:MAG: extracellular solute-binding protein [Propionibacteriaceae bacterium]|jgi:N,N'-diacetylchitobiose transport system substrate-binding protein|nr:extracellular solute-binding protein [Propionibacteriaceae bacterium]
MKRMMALAALATAGALMLSACGTQGTSGNQTSSGGSSQPASTAAGQDITLWLAGGDTPDTLRDYLKTTYNSTTGGTLTIEEQSWSDLVSKLTTALPDPNNTPDVVEVGNTQSPTFTNVGAFADISDMYAELGGDKLLQSFVEVGKVDGKNYTLPYYFGSRYMFYRKDVWKAAGVEVPTTLDEFNSAVATLAEKNPDNIKNFSGFFIGGQDWRNGISWIFANGGDLAKYENGQWVSTLSDANTIKGLQQLQEIWKVASNAPSTAKDESPWLYINDNDSVTDENGKVTEKTSFNAATIMAPGWAHWSIGDLVKGDDGKEVRQWNDDKFGVFVLPGNDGKPAPVFAGGSNIGISAASQKQEGARALLKIIFSAEYQQMLGENGLGPANSDYTSSLGDDEFAKALIESASNSKLTPAAPGWATVEGSMKLEEFFGKVSEGGDIASLAKEYDDVLTPMLNGS